MELGTRTEEHDVVCDLEATIAGFMPADGLHERWCWGPSPIEGFSVKSCYNVLMELYNYNEVDDDFRKTVKRLWASDVPSKVLIFEWRLL